MPNFVMPSSLMTDIIEQLPYTILVIDRDDNVIYGNGAAEYLFLLARTKLTKLSVNDILASDSPLFDIISRARQTGLPVSITRIAIETANRQRYDNVDIYVSPLPDQPYLLIIIQAIFNVGNNPGGAKDFLPLPGNMANFLSHEIKNPLAAIRAAAQLLLKSSHVNKQDSELLNIITGENDRIVKLLARVDKLIDPFDNIASLKFDAVNIHEILDYVIALTEVGSSANITINRDFDPSLPLIKGDRDMLIQVFVNLISNAIEAIEGDSAYFARRKDISPSITLKTEYDNAAKITGTAAFSSGRFDWSGFGFPASGFFSGDKSVRMPIICSVINNGSGIDDSIANNLFEPFVSSKYNGSGLGLTIVARIIDYHGGVVTGRSKRDLTTFSVRLPYIKNIAAD